MILLWGPPNQSLFSVIVSCWVFDVLTSKKIQSVAKFQKKMKKVGFFEKIARIRKRNDTELILKNRAFFKESIFSKLTLSHLEKNAIFSILGG